MTADALAVVQFLFGTIWQFFTSWYIPGTRMTPAVFLLGTIAAGLVLSFFLKIIQSESKLGGDK